MIISILIPTFNEEENVIPLSNEIIRVFEEQLPNYNYEIVFIDNCSVDGTRENISRLCNQNANIKAIFNAKNFGQFNSPYYGLCQTEGDCTILMCADFQDPVDMIPEFVHEWEKGYKIVCGIKTSSKENSMMYFLRSCYYKLIKKLSDVEQIEHFTGFGLYDKSFIDVLRNLNDPSPFLRGIVAELGPSRKDIPYEQAKRRAGKTSNNFYKLYDAAMLSFTSYTKIGMRLATMVGFTFAVLSLIVGLVYFIYKLVNWNNFSTGIAPLIIGVFVIGSLQLFFIGLLGEYILNINTRVTNRPLVIEEKRLNFSPLTDENMKSNTCDKGSTEILDSVYQASMNSTIK
ncbi:glycosyltransferase family 2 protein [Paenibacillus puldeungensis]|uniref:Glycosyltransferase family 2 protein n=1 Tax=Paenibacillus puldeungensis TaxID=696536 RepID=A0ABW3S487_9BACL